MRRQVVTPMYNNKGTIGKAVLNIISKTKFSALALVHSVYSVLSTNCMVSTLIVLGCLGKHRCRLAV